MRFLLFSIFFCSVYSFLPNMVFMGKNNIYYATYYSKFFRIPLISSETYVSPNHYVIAVENINDLGYFLDEYITIVDLDKFHNTNKSANYFISWLVQNYT